MANNSSNQPVLLQLSIITFLVSTCLFFVVSTAKASEIVFINQVRGGECCGAGSTTNLKTQLDAFSDNHIPATFALRYDALTDSQYTSLMKTQPQHEIAGLLEITPSLATAANVPYNAPEELWHKARHVFLVGYSPEEREQLIDTYMSAFFQVFGTYPTTTVAWMIDAHSLDYLQTKYGITAHQITREQWGTDSYTLHGGPPTGAYFASPNWPLIPISCSHNVDKTEEFTKREPLPDHTLLGSQAKPDRPARQSVSDGGTRASTCSLLILRQTVADPLMNYGDDSNSFTSQPNDYLQNKTFDYFTKLADQMLAQGPLILGLENSMDEQTQLEFTKQIVWAANRANNNDVRIMTSTQLSADFKPPVVSVIHGQDLENQDDKQQAIWITTPSYRLRIRRHNTYLAITDIRLYHEHFTDPYQTAASTTSNGYWIIPFLIDGSRYNPYPQARGLLSKITSRLTQTSNSQPIIPEYIFAPKPDIDTDDTTIFDTYHLALPEINPNSTYTFETVHPDENRLTYRSGKTDVILTFQPDMFTLTSHTPPRLKGEDTHSLPIQSSITIHPFHWLPQIELLGGEVTTLTWVNQDVPLWKIDISQKDNQYTFNPQVNENVNLDEARRLFPNELSPETIFTPIDPAQSSVYFHNTTAIAGRNHIHFFISPRDKTGIPTKADSVDITSHGQVPDSLTIQPPTTNTGHIRADMYEPTPASYDLDISLDGTHITTQTIRFVTNCKQTPIACIQNPLEGIRYFLTKFQETHR